VSTEHRLHRVGDLADRGAGARRRDRQFQQVAVARLTTLGDLGQTPLQLQYKPRRHTLPPAPVLPPGESLSVHASVDTCHHIDWQLQQVAIARLTTPGDLRQKPLQLHTQ